jgi:hypothetical protein
MSLGFGALGQGPLGDSQRRLSEFIIRTSQVGGSLSALGLILNDGVLVTTQLAYSQSLGTLTDYGSVELAQAQNLSSYAIVSSNGALVLEQAQTASLFGALIDFAEINTEEVSYSQIVATLVDLGNIQSSQTQGLNSYAVISNDGVLSLTQAQTTSASAIVTVYGTANTKQAQHTFASEVLYGIVGVVNTHQVQTTYARGTVTSKENPNNIGGSGIYYGPWGAPFVLPFANTYYEKEGKKRRSRVAVAVRFSRVDRWKRTAIDTRLLPQDIRVSVHIPEQDQHVEQVPTEFKPKFTVNASTLRFLRNRMPSIDLSEFTLVESKKVTIDDLLPKLNLVEATDIKENSYKINASVFVDRLKFTVAVTMPTDQQLRPYAVDVDLSNS